MVENSIVAEVVVVVDSNIGQEEVVVVVDSTVEDIRYILGNQGSG